VIAAGAAGGAGKLALDRQDDDNEVELSLDQVPAAVRDTLVREARGARIDTVERETENGRTVYEAEVTVDGKEVEIEVDAAGRLLGVEVDDEDDDQDDDD
jgi:uncharacterized membrane protein YkoI